MRLADLKVVGGIEELHNGEIQKVFNRLFKEAAQLVCNDDREKVQLDFKIIIQQNEDDESFVDIKATGQWKGNPIITNTYSLQKTKKGLRQNANQLELFQTEGEDEDAGRHGKSMSTVQ